MNESSLFKITQISSIPAIILLLFLEIKSLYEVEMRQNQVLEKLEEVILLHCKENHAETRR